jgi:hypothetical protein
MTRGQSNERMRRGDATTSWCDKLTRWRNNERMTRGSATTSWHDKMTRGWRDKRRLVLSKNQKYGALERKMRKSAMWSKRASELKDI